MHTSRREFIQTASLGGLALAGTSFALLNRAVASIQPSATIPKVTVGLTPWSCVDYGCISIGGDLARRAEENWKRLQHPAYAVPRAFTNPVTPDWPGDWVGRDLLAKTLLARSLSREAPEAKKIVQELPKRVNAQGILGPALNLAALNEQQLGGHGWLIRGLYEYADWTQDSAAWELMHTMVRNLATPMNDTWKSYPLTRNDRQRGAGAMLGSAGSNTGRWVLTTDIGSIFILLDGLTQAWQIERSTALKATIDEGIEHFLRMDPLAVQAQTHATLTTLRAMLRLYHLTNDPHLLRAVENRYALYREVAMTENYANYNWFERPTTWTEPCAVIDSFMVAIQLWRFTDEAKYLADAHLIWFNGVGHGQRANGGYGTDTCAGAGTPFLKMSLYEAFFCCTMRGGEGHSSAIQSAYHTRPGKLAVTFYCDSKATLDLGSGQIVLQQATQYPYAGRVQFTVVSSTLSTPIAIHLFLPPWMERPTLRLNERAVDFRISEGFLVAGILPRAGDVLIMDCTLKTWSRPTQNPHSLSGYHVFHAGPLVLGYEGNKELFVSGGATLSSHGPGRCRLQGTDVVLTRINDINELPPPARDVLDDPHTMSPQMVSESDSHRRQIMFRES
ncbi:MAG: twin-arginine translocation signal domain-containing protein [Lacunisphaera sp.]